MPGRRLGKPKSRGLYGCQNVRRGFYPLLENSLPPVNGVLTVERLSKRYGSVQALDQVSFEVPRGSIFGLLGPNGSGKTSLLGVVLGILQPAAGRFRWADGLKLGALLETPNFYPYLNGADNLRIVAELRGRGREQLNDVLAQVGLDKSAHLTFGQYSLGMKQRLGIGAALLGDPEVVVLDEPTNGLDPAGIADVRELIRAMAQGGRTVLLASHLLDEVEKVCTDVAILKKGHLLACGTLADVLRDEDTLELSCADLDALESALRKHPLQPRLRRHNGTLAAQFPAGQTTGADLNRYCMDEGVTLSHLVLRKKTLESRFLELTDAP